VRIFSWALIFACLLIPVGTQARTGLVCVAALVLLALRDVKRRFLYIGALSLVALAAVPMLPSSFSDRMSTIQEYKADESASTRLAIWAWTIDYATKNPFGGGFEAYRQNRLQIAVTNTEGSGQLEQVKQEMVADQGRAYHSSYFEMLGEQGFPGLALYLLLHGYSVVRMEVLRRRFRGRPGADEWVGSLAGALQSAHLIYLVGSLFVGLAFMPFMFMLIGAEIGLDNHLKRQAKLAAGEKRVLPTRSAEKLSLHSA
jgi:O-antigen ligase